MEGSLFYKLNNFYVHCSIILPSSVNMDSPSGPLVVKENIPFSQIRVRQSWLLTRQDYLKRNLDFYQELEQEML